MFLKDKTALITGGGGGIGWGIALEFAKEGAIVVLIDINETRGSEVLEQLLEISPNHKFYEQDITKIDELLTTTDKIISELKHHIDILVNNAGINTPNNFLDMMVENWEKVYDTNVKGHFFLSQKIAKHFIENKIEGNILWLSSIHQDIVQGRPHYASSKAAIKMLVKEMAAELAPHSIRVNAIAPGGIHVDERVENPNLSSNEPTVLLGGKNGIPRDVGRAAVFFCSDYWSRHVTGETLVVSGGQYLYPYIKK